MKSKPRKNVDRPTMNLALKAAILATREHQKRIAQLAKLDESRLSQIVNDLKRPANLDEQHRLLAVLRALLPEHDQDRLTSAVMFPQIQETAK